MRWFRLCPALLVSFVAVAEKLPKTSPQSCLKQPGDLEAFVRGQFPRGVPFAQAREFESCTWAVTAGLDLLKHPEQQSFADNIVLTLGILGRIESVDGLVAYLESPASESVSLDGYRSRSSVLIALGCILNQVDLDLTRNEKVDRQNVASLDELRSARKYLINYVTEGIVDPDIWQSRLGWETSYEQTSFDRNLHMTKKAIQGATLSGDRDVRCVLAWTQQHLRQQNRGVSISVCGLPSLQGPHQWGREQLKSEDLLQLQRLLQQAVATNDRIFGYPEGLAEYYQPKK